MSDLRSITAQTPDGDFTIIIDGKDVARTSGFGDIETLAARLPEELQGAIIEPILDHAYKKYIDEYYEGNPTALDNIPRGQDGSEFQKAVWKAIDTISYGSTVSYKQLAENSGNPAAIRAAGTICGLNRLILLIPCHRVLKSDGSIGSYLYGPEIKASLLKREQELRAI